MSPESSPHTAASRFCRSFVFGPTAASMTRFGRRKECSNGSPPWRRPTMVAEMCMWPTMPRIRRGMPGGDSAAPSGVSMQTGHRTSDSSSLRSPMTTSMCLMRVSCRLAGSHLAQPSDRRAPGRRHGARQSRRRQRRLAGDSKPNDDQIPRGGRQGARSSRCGRHAVVIDLAPCAERRSRLGRRLAPKHYKHFTARLPPAIDRARAPAYHPRTSCRARRMV
jgi:hypothetical protein